jgi:L-methionine (R)-S-oxide reductase
MPLVDASNSQTSTEVRFELLSEVYFDPFIEKFSPSWIGLFEQVRTSAVLRSYRGSTVQKEDLRLFQQQRFESLNQSQFVAAADSVRQLSHPLQWRGEILGWLLIESSHQTKTFSDAEVMNIAGPLSCLLAWKDSPWSTRVEALSTLKNLQVHYSDFDWIGIYRRALPAQDLLVLSTYIGEYTQHTEIPISEGICGAAVREERTLNIPNVHADPRFIACSIKTQSELVVPIRNSSDRVVAEIDIDSNTLENFSSEKIASVEAAANQLGQLPELFRE